MPKPTLLRRILSEAGPLIAVTVVATVVFSIMGPASAQFFDFGFGRPPTRQQQQQQQRGGFGGFGGGFFSPFQQIFPGPSPTRPHPQPSQQQQQQQQRAVDYSHAPSPEKREAPAEHNVLV